MHHMLVWIVGTPYTYKLIGSFLTALRLYCVCNKQAGKYTPVFGHNKPSINDCNLHIGFRILYLFQNASRVHEIKGKKKHVESYK